MASHRGREIVGPDAEVTTFIGCRAAGTGDNDKVRSGNRIDQLGGCLLASAYLSMMVDGAE